MTVKFTFANGKEHEFDYDWLKMAPKLQLAGLRLFKPSRGVLIPLNSNTIALIEHIEDIVSEELDEILEEFVEKVEVAELVEKSPVEENPISAEERNKRALAQMKEMSECTHETREFYYQEIMSGTKTNQKMQKRYFPVCVVCGLRERYVKADSLTDDERLNAKKWDK